MKQKKTNAMRTLEQKKIEYTPHFYQHKKGDSVDGISVCEKLGQPFHQVYKTLVTHDTSNQHFVFMIPVDQELDLKKAAKVAKVKKLEMIPMKDLLSTTGYIRGGCSPIGMKKEFPTFFHEEALLYETIYFSGGAIGTQIQMRAQILKESFGFLEADLIKE